MLNQPRATGEFDWEEPLKSFKYITSKNYPKHLYKKLYIIYQYPIRLLIDDVQFLNQQRASRADISNLIEPIPDMITFVYSEQIGLAGLPTPFMVAHNVGHAIQEITSYSDNEGADKYKTNEYRLQSTGFGNRKEDEYEFTNMLESVIARTVVEIARANPELPWLKLPMYKWHAKDLDSWETSNNYFQGASIEDPDTRFFDGRWMQILTPGIDILTEDGMSEYAPNLVASYMRFGRIKFRVGSARKIERFIDEMLRSFIGRTIALS